MRPKNLPCHEVYGTLYANLLCREELRRPVNLASSFAFGQELWAMADPIKPVGQKAKAAPLNTFCQLASRLASRLAS
jgi:hypothetical protein